MKKSSIIFSVLMIALISSCSKTETTTPQKVDIIDAVFASGYIIYEYEYQVIARAEGYLVSSTVEEGSMVEAQTPLFQLSNEVQGEQLFNAQLNYQDAIKRLDQKSPDRIKQELQIEQAKAQVDLEFKNYQRYKKLRETEAVSKADYERAALQYENAKSNLAFQEAILADLIENLELSAKNAQSQVVIQKETNTDYFLSSKISGEVLNIFKEPGELVKRGEVVATIGGGKKLAKLFISEEDISLVATNQKAVLNLNTDRDNNYVGRVQRIYPSFDTNEQSFMVEASFEQLPFTLYHNTQLQANIIVDEKANALVIPQEYLDQNSSQVRLKNGDWLPVKTGIRNDKWVEVLEGLSDEQVLVRPEEL